MSAPAQTIAVTDGTTSLSRDALALRAAELASTLRRASPRIAALALLADNGIDWIVVDRAAEAAGIPIVPLPPFFTPSQMTHAIAASGADAIATADASIGKALGFDEGTALPTTGLVLQRHRTITPRALPAGTAKITFTSGTTGAPKGVCLDAAVQWRVADSLASVLRDAPIERHLCLLPLPVLLENVAGVYGPMVRGVTACVPPVRDTGLRGAAAFDPLACLQAIERFDAHSVILLPQMLMALVGAVSRGARVPASLRFAAVGGAKVAPSLLTRARALGLPVFEGYGLSECASVVALNVPGADAPGTVGKPLPHVRVRMQPGGEIVVEGASFLGYAGASVANAAAPLATGDLGRVDGDGFLRVEGRCKEVLITSYGRNVSPEWPEAELVAGGAIAQAAVFGDGQPALCAVLVPRDPLSGDAALAAAVDTVNARLPDYARIGNWLRADEPFTPGNGLATINGRVRREMVLHRYRERIDRLHAESATHHDV